MMLSPLSVYEELKDLPPEKILREIRSLKRSLSKLKREEEKKKFKPIEEALVMIDPSPEIQIEYIREYLFSAILAYKNAGGKYKPTRAEDRALDFQMNIPYISEIKLIKGGFFEGRVKYTFTIDKYSVYCNVEDWRNCERLDRIEPVSEISKERLFEKLEKLYIGEWLTTYSPRRFGYDVLDGNEWDLEIHYSNGKRPFKSGGCNDQPYNFDELLEVLGIEEDEEDFNCEDEEE